MPIFAYNVFVGEEDTISNSISRPVCGLIIVNRWHVHNEGGLQLESQATQSHVQTQGSGDYRVLSWLCQVSSLEFF